MEKKKISPLKTVTWIAAAFILIAYGNFTINSVIFGSGIREVTVGLSAILAAGCAALFNDRFPSVLRVILCVGMCVYVVTYSAFAFAILSSEDADITAMAGDEVPIVMVFGCRTYGLTPGKQLRERLDAAYDLLAANPDAIAIVSGGQGYNETIPEAVAMKSYLESRGIDGARIYTESDSSSTEENIAYSMALIEEENLTGHPVIAVSSYYHLPRISYLAAREGMYVDGYGCGRNTIRFFFDFNLVREYMAYVKLILRSIV